MEDFSLSICNGSTERFYGQIYWKKWFSDRIFYVTITDTDIGSLKSLHTLFDKQHAGENLKKNSYGKKFTKFWAFCQNMVNTFGKVFTPFWKTFLWHKQLFNANVLTVHCFKNYGCPTRVTRLKVAPNMADPNSLYENLP